MASSDPSADPSRTAVSRADGDEGQIGATIQLIKDYARQETLGPLRGAGRWLAGGAAGAFCYGLATVFLVLAALRLMQNEFGPTFAGRWMSIVPYIVAFVVGLAVIAVAAMRISRKPLNKEDR